VQSTAVDAAPLVALFDRGERAHERTKQFFAQHKRPLVTNWLAIGEAAHLLDFNQRVQIDFVKWAGTALVIDERTSADLDRIVEVMLKYNDLPVDLTDASLLAMCERRGIREIASLNSDFDVLRTRQGKVLKNLLTSIR
jgi:hypothetical protein